MQHDRRQGQKGQRSAGRQQAAAPTIRAGHGSGSRSGTLVGQIDRQAIRQQQRQDSDSMRAARNKAGQDMARRHDTRSARARTHKEQRKQEAMRTQRRAAQTTEGKKEEARRSQRWDSKGRGVGVEGDGHETEVRLPRCGYRPIRRNFQLLGNSFRVLRKMFCRLSDLFGGIRFFPTPVFWWKSFLRIPCPTRAQRRIKIIGNLYLFSNKYQFLFRY